MRDTQAPSAGMSVAMGLPPPLVYFCADYGRKRGRRKSQSYQCSCVAPPALGVRIADNPGLAFWLVATLENKPGKAGSLAVYAALAARHGSINLAAAREGLVMFAEHTADARLHPGSHPNIE